MLRNTQMMSPATAAATTLDQAAVVGDSKYSDTALNARLDHGSAAPARPSCLSADQEGTFQIADALAGHQRLVAEAEDQVGRGTRQVVWNAHRAPMIVEISLDQ